MAKDASTRATAKRVRATETTSGEDREVKQKLNDGTPKRRGTLSPPESVSSIGEEPERGRERLTSSSGQNQTPADSASKGPVRKRGRPRLPSSERKTPVKPKVPGRGRGRPRLPSSERKTPAKPKGTGRGRGRPRIPGGPTDQKEGKVAAPEKDADVPKKKRGRPPKSTAPAEKSPKPQVTTTKPRGRPRKANQISLSDHNPSSALGNLSGNYETISGELSPSQPSRLSVKGQKIAIFHDDSSNTIWGEFELGEVRGAFKTPPGQATTGPDAKIDFDCRIRDTRTWDVQQEKSDGSLSQVQDKAKQKLIRVSLKNIFQQNVVLLASKHTELPVDQNEEVFKMKWLLLK